ncbi:MAG: aminoglycoside 6-adenylyltransferase [Flavisolibacter sp.]|jgi:predicted nucleotidyltransferase
MIQLEFANHIVSIVKQDPQILGIAAAGSWIGNNMDEFSDIDLIVVSNRKISHKEEMFTFAEKFGHLLSYFTGEHVGESRLLICLYADPFLHVDFKFLNADEFGLMIEKPAILFDRTGILKEIQESAEPKWPFEGYQWIEDRFWVWIHYLIQKLARGEYFEVLDGMAFLRRVVLAPMVRIRNGLLPKGIRRIEMDINADELDLLKLTLSEYDAASLFTAINNAASFYTSLRTELYEESVLLRKEAEEMVMDYVSVIGHQFIQDSGR